MAVTLRKFAGAEQACEKLRLELAIAAHTYRLSVAFVDEADMDARCALLAPWLLPLLAHGHGSSGGAHLALVLGDSLTQTVYISRRAMRLFVTRSRHPVALAPLSAHPAPLPVGAQATQATRATRATRASAHASQWSQEPQEPQESYEQYGPVARLALLQAEALRAVAARMATDLRAGMRGECYVVTTPVALADASALAVSGQPCHVLAFPLPLPHPAISAASSHSGPLL